MAIIVNIDVMLAKRKMSVTELSEKLGITMANVSILRLLINYARFWIASRGICLLTKKMKRRRRSKSYG